jgi:hypothetical protein
MLITWPVRVLASRACLVAGVVDAYIGILAHYSAEVCCGNIPARPEAIGTVYRE